MASANVLSVQVSLSQTIEQHDSGNYRMVLQLRNPLLPSKHRFRFCSEMFPFSMFVTVSSALKENMSEGGLSLAGRPGRPGVHTWNH